MEAPVLENPRIWALTAAHGMVWMMALTRMTGLMAAMPGFGQERVPLQVRGALALLLATIITPVIPGPKTPPDGIPSLLVVMATELAVGLLLGTMVAWITEAVGFGGQQMDFQMGFAFAQFYDPASGQNTSIAASLLMQLTVLFILISGLHHQMILALVESYRLVPLGSGLPIKPFELIVMVGQMLLRGFQLSFPVLLVLGLVDILQGVSAKFMPQLQLIQLSFPLKIAVGLAIVAWLLREFQAWLIPLIEAAPLEGLRLLR